MIKAPRKLNLLVIDDRYRSAESELPGFVTPRFESVRTITTFLQAQEVISRINEVAGPDLVVIDINFKDDKSDLFGMIDKPMGLLYGLCFLVCARVRALPMGFAHYTADAGRWQLMDSSDMKSLAVTLAAISAALTRERDIELEIIDSDNANKAFEWIRAHKADNPEEATKLAVAHYRNSLSRLCQPEAASGRGAAWVVPDSYVELTKACNEWALLPAETVLSGSEQLRNCGLKIVLNDTAEYLSIEGLFPELAGDLRAGDFRSSDNQGNEMFQDTHLRPRVREFIDSIARWPQIYREAVGALARLGDGQRRHEESITKIVPKTVSDAALIRAATLALQIARMYRWAWEKWTADWNMTPIVPWEDDGAQDENEAQHEETFAKTYRQWLSELIETVRMIEAQDEVGDEGVLADALIERGWKKVYADWRFYADDILDAKEIIEFMREAEQFVRNSNSVQKGGIDAVTLGVLKWMGTALTTVTAQDRHVLKHGVGDKSDRKVIAKLLNATIEAHVSDDSVCEDESGAWLARAKLEACPTFSSWIRSRGVLSDWVRRCLRSLEAWGYLRWRHSGSGFGWTTTSDRDVSEMAPSSGNLHHPAWLSDSGLAKSAGMNFYADGIDTIDEAAGLEKGTLKGIVNGGSRSPAWLRYLAVQFCLDNDWTDRAGWPPFCRE